MKGYGYVRLKKKFKGLYIPGAGPPTGGNTRDKVTGPPSLGGPPRGREGVLPEVSKSKEGGELGFLKSLRQ